MQHIELSLFSYRKVRLILFVFVVCLFVSSCNKKNREYHVLLIQSYEQTYDRAPELIEGVQRVFAEKGIPLVMNTYYMDCEVKNSLEELNFLNKLLDLYVGKKLDLILVCDDQATYSLFETKHPLSYSTPIVFCGVDYPNAKQLKAHPNATGFTVDHDFLKCYELAKSLLPVQQVYFLSDATYLGKEVTEDFHAQWKAMTDSIPIININATQTSNKSLIWGFCNAKPKSIFIIPRFDNTYPLYIAKTNAPVFIMTNESFSDNTLGGYIVDEKEQTSDAARVGLEILNGKNPCDIPIAKHRQQPTFSWKQLMRWQIDLDLLPANSVIVGKPFYHRYKIWIHLGILFAIGLLVRLIYVYIRERRRKQTTERKLMAQKEYLYLSLNDSNVYLFQYDADSQILHYQNDLIHSGKAHTENELNTISLTDFRTCIHSLDLALWDLTLNSLIEDKNQRTVCRFRIKYAPREYEWWEYRLSRSHVSVDPEIKVFGLCLNVDEYMQRENELLMAKQLASNAELKQSFLANMSHEIRTPLNAIVGFSNLLVNDNALSQEEKEAFVGSINLNNELLLKLIDDIVDLSRIESNNISFDARRCSANQLIDELFANTDVVIPKEIQLTKQLASEPVYIITDSKRIIQILDNFLSNAVKFAPTGKLTVGFSLLEESYIDFFVADSGKGIPVDEQQMIFERFYKRDEFAQGTGLGLPICKAIAERLGGGVFLQSEEGRGACFILRLPLPKD